MSSVFVTGGSGFIGQRLLRAFQQAGTSVRALARSEQAAAQVQQYGAVPVRGSLLDASALQEGVQGCKTAIHLAALMDHTQHLADLTAANVAGTQHMLDAARVAGVTRFIHMSTAAVYAGGPALRNADESWPVPQQPLGPYAATKAEAERRVLQANTPTFTTLALRPCFVWGVGDTSVLPMLLEQVRERRFTWVDGGRQQLSTCHVENVVAGVCAALEHGRGGEAYLLADGAPIELRTFFTDMLAVYGIAPGERSIPRWLARAASHLIELPWRILPLSSPPPTHLRSIIDLLGQDNTVSDAKARRELGYVPVMSREAGLAEMRAGAGAVSV